MCFLKERKRKERSFHSKQIHGKANNLFPDCHGKFRNMNIYGQQFI